MGVEEVVAEFSWAGGYVQDGRIFTQVETTIPEYKRELDWWPTPQELDMHEYTCVRRDRMAGRFMAWWLNVTTTKLQQGPDTTPIRVFNGKTGINPRSASYRTVLAAQELAAQIEKYAKAWRDDGGVSPVIPEGKEAALVKKVNEAAVAYCEAHKPAPNGEPDTDFVTYMEACATWNADPGTSWADIQRMLNEQAPVGQPAEEEEPEAPF